VGGRIILDLGEVRGMDYYTGITFRAVAPGLGWPLVSGGRYDDLISGFGRSMEAVGWGLGIERVLLAQARQGAPSPDIAPHLLVSGCDDPTCLALVARMRDLGLRVVVDLLALDGVGLSEVARAQGIDRVLQREGDQWLLTTPSSQRRLGLEQLLAEAQKWSTRAVAGAVASTQSSAATEKEERVL
jgi:histidyl-tRNA synthetase